MKDVSPDVEISSAVIRLAIFVIFAKVAGALKEVGLAAYYGVGPILDAYLLNFSVVSALSAIWLGMLSAVLVPLLVQATNARAEDTKLFHGELVGWTAVLGLSLALVYAVTMPQVAQLQALALTAATSSRVATQSLIFSTLVPMGMLVGLATSIMLASRRHISSLAEGIPAAILLVFIVVSNGGEPALTWGTVFGWLAQLGALSLLLARAKQLPTPLWTRRSSYWAALVSGMAALGVGQVLSSLSEVVDNFFAAPLGEGSISLLSYANRLLGIATAIGSTVLVRAALPIFASSFSSEPDQYRLLVLRWTKLACVAGVVALALGWPLASSLVQLFFERGAFNASDARRVAELLQLSLLQLPFFLPGVVLAGGLAAAGAYGAIGMIAALNLAVKIAASAFFTEQHGLSGLPLATAIMYMVAFGACVIALNITTTTPPK